MKDHYAVDESGCSDAGDVIAVTCKATNGNKGKFEATVKSILIGAVPDRGGRPAEGRAAAALASMPAWAPRSAGKIIKLSKCLIAQGSSSPCMPSSSK